MLRPEEQLNDCDLTSLKPHEIGQRDCGGGNPHGWLDLGCARAHHCSGTQWEPGKHRAIYSNSNRVTSDE